MTVDEKLAAILAAVQIDPGNRGLARDPDDNLFTATAGQFQAACRSIAEHPNPRVRIYTGFFIPTAEPPSFESDGPLGATFISWVFSCLDIAVDIRADAALLHSVSQWDQPSTFRRIISHVLALERPGPTYDGTFRTMRGIDISSHHEAVHAKYVADAVLPGVVTIGIGDGGNEIGMGKISPKIMTANIPSGAAVHCRIGTDYLIVAGVSNWGAYALAAGVALVRSQMAGGEPVRLPHEDERTRLEWMNSTTTPSSMASPADRSRPSMACRGTYTPLRSSASAKSWRCHDDGR